MFNGHYFAEEKRQKSRLSHSQRNREEKRNWPRKVRGPCILVLEGNSEIGAHVRRILCYFIYKKAFDQPEISHKFVFFSENTYFPSRNIFCVTINYATEIYVLDTATLFKSEFPLRTCFPPHFTNSPPPPLFPLLFFFKISGGWI